MTLHIARFLERPVMPVTTVNRLGQNIAITRKQDSVVVYIVFAKSFDKVAHGIFCQQLKDWGISGILVMDVELPK